MIRASGEETPKNILKFSVTGHAVCKENEAGTNFRILAPDLCSLNVFLYNENTIAYVADDKPEDSPAIVNFSCLGAGCCGGVPLFVSSQGLLVKIHGTRTKFTANDILPKSASDSRQDASLVATTSSGVRGPSSELASQLKAAFLRGIKTPGVGDNLYFRNQHQPDFVFSGATPSHYNDGC